MIFLLLACDIPKETPPLVGTRCGDPALAERATPTQLPKDSVLRFNEIQARGSHNSYHVEPEHPLDDSWRYTQPSLTEQLETYGVRQLELDLHLREDGVLEVFHVPVADAVSNCPLFEDCLVEICRWSAVHSDHAPVMVWLEPKDELDGGDGYLSLLGQDSLVQAAILEIFPEDQLYQPDDWKRGHASLGEATRTEGAPLLGDLRGRVLFGIIDSGEHREAYLSEAPDLTGKMFFPDTDTAEDSFAAMVKDAEASQIAGLLASGLVVTSNVDSAGGTPEENAAGRDAALAGGLNYAATDFVAPADPYWMELPGGEPLRCNPVNAPEGCVASDVEGL